MKKKAGKTKPKKQSRNKKKIQIKARTKSVSKVAKRKRKNAPLAVASISSGSAASSLDPQRQVIVESDEEARPATHKGDLAGDLQGLSTRELYDSESVSELIEEGQDLEAELIEGVEEAPDADQGEVRVHEAPKHDVPDYKDRNKL